MDLHFASSCSPFSYLISEHARAVVAIQELQREVNSLLCFRDHVLEALPHLQLRGEAAPRPPRPTSAPGGKSLSEGPSTVVDSGFSTDKASTSIGKSSSGSSGEMSGGTRWDPEAGGGGSAGPPPLGSAEDELWQLLEVIQKKGSKLRKDLEKAEQSERDYAHVPCDPPPAPGRAAPLQQQRGGGEGTKGPLHDWYPHSLPGTGPRLDFVPGLEAWGEVERLRQDRLYLMGRLSRAETEAASSHQRLIDLHGQLLSLAGEKRRLEDTFRKAGDEVAKGVGGHHPRGSRSSVTVSVKGGAEDLRGRTSSVRIGEEAVQQLPRALKLPIRDKNRTHPSSRIPQGGSPSKTTLLLPVKENCVPIATHHGRVVIERERSANRIDGGFSMPASLLKGSRIQVRPNKQRISAILREKDVLALQKHLLTTVMETEVLRRQMEIASEEWMSKVCDWELEKKQHSEAQAVLAKENQILKLQLSRRKETRDAATCASPMMQSIAVGTHEDAPATHSVHQGPNVKYDVVVYEESPLRKVPPSPAPRRTPAVEKPPRKTRPLSGGLQESSFGRDSLGRVAKVPLKSLSTRAPPPSSTYLSTTTTTTTPSSTPKTSPAPSISKGVRQQEPRTPTGRLVTRRDSNKTLSSSASSSCSTVGVGPQSLTNGKGGNSSLNHASPVKGSVGTPVPKTSKTMAPHKTAGRPWWRLSQNGGTNHDHNGPRCRPSSPPEGVDNRTTTWSDGGDPLSSLTPPSDSLDYYDSITKTPLASTTTTDGRALYPWASMLKGDWEKDSLEWAVSSPPKALRRQVFLGGPPGAIRIKNNNNNAGGRPSVLPSAPRFDGQDPLVLKGALDDVNLRVEQILSRIAANAK